MPDPSITDLAQGGALGILTIFVVLVWRALEGMRKEQREDRLEVGNTLDKIAERLVRIDERTYRAEVDGSIPVQVVDEPTRSIRRRRTPVVGVRTKPQTPFMGGEGDDR